MFLPFVWVFWLIQGNPARRRRVIAFASHVEFLCWDSFTMFPPHVLGILPTYIVLTSSVKNFLKIYYICKKYT